MLLALGCAHEPYRPPPQVRAQLGPWTWEGREGCILRTDHYVIHSTIEDRGVLRMIAQVMEGAHRQYQQFVPGVRVSTKPMECFIFAHRTEWAEFTRQRTGNDATIYLQINRGGYTIRDWYVAYYIGDVGTYAVAAHEGWHQFVARNFKSRLPPFLEEGIATMFEMVNWSNGQPRWDPADNPTRAEKLHRAVEQDSLWPLEKLVTMHAGDVVSLSGERIETFYAQNWAFAQFLWDADNARYRSALQRMLADLAAGHAPAHVARVRAGNDMWEPASARPLLEHYLGMSLDEIERAYLAYVRSIAKPRRLSFGT
jgi:hypothetical protein